MRQRRVLNCCGGSFCKNCLKSPSNKEHIIDWCPLCRAFVPHYEEDKKSGKRKKFEQAQRLVTKGSAATTSSSSTSSPLDQGIRLLEELLLQYPPDDSSVPQQSDIQLTLSRALYKKHSPESWYRAEQILQDIIASAQNSTEQQQQQSTRAQASSHQVIKYVDRKRIAQAHFLLAEMLQRNPNHPCRLDQPTHQQTDQPTLTDADQRLQIVQHHYDQAVANDPFNIAMLSACAKKTSDPQKAFQYHRHVLQINKYHIESNLWIANYYHQYFQQQHLHHHQQQQLLRSYFACVVRAEYKLSVTTRTSTDSQQRQQQQQYQACQQHHQYLQQKHSSCHQFMIHHMDRVCAASVDVIMVE
jgi:hypothetical protein